MKIGNVNGVNYQQAITPNVKMPEANVPEISEPIKASKAQGGNFDAVAEHIKEKLSPDNENGVNDDLLKEAVDQANQSLKLYDRKIERTIHEVTKTVMYTLKDTRTNEVIAEFPPKKIQDMIAKMWELAGLFVDKKA